MPKVDPTPKSTKTPARPKLTNRGPAGLLHKVKEGEVPKTPITQVPTEAPIDRIASDLLNLTVPIGELTPDPQNARQHPERNLEAIKDSLKLYGQVKPLVVRRETGVVIAGNGTLEAAKQLGWTRLAVTKTEMDEVQAIGYGLADNRTAELAKWDFEVVARLDKLLLEAGHASVGWTPDELEVLRAADWTPPEVTGDAGTSNGKSGDEPLVVGFTPDEYEIIGRAVERVRNGKAGEDMQGDLSQAECLVRICKEWLGEIEDPLPPPNVETGEEDA